MTTTASTHSAFHAKTLEHMLIGDVLRCLWLKGVHDAEVLFADVAAAGYNVVIEVNGCVRHIQLKSSFIGATTASQKINIGLSNKPSGCVVWINYDNSTMELGPFLWFGGEPGTPLPSIDHFRVGKHTKGTSEGDKLERPNTRVINKGKFTRIDTTEMLVARLFGI